LLAVLTLTMLLGVAVALAFPLVIGGVRGGARSAWEAAASAAAAQGLEVGAAELGSAELSAVPNGATASVRTLSAPGNLSITLELRRLSPELWLLTSRAGREIEISEGGARASVGLLLRLARIPGDTVPVVRRISRAWLSLPDSG
jgi:hypothetical protein